MPGPTIQSLPIIRRTIGQFCGLSISCTTGTAGASRCIRCSAVKLKLITRAGEAGRRCRCPS